MNFATVWHLMVGVVIGMVLFYAWSEYDRRTLNACVLTVWPNGRVVFSPRCSARAVIALEESGMAGALVSPD